MRPDPSLLWRWNRKIDRLPYLLTGVFLFVIKFGIDWTVANVGFGRSWSPINYLIWPNSRTLEAITVSRTDQWFSLTMLLVSLPFIWTGVALSLHRLRAAGLPLGLILLFFVPLVNLLFFLVLVLMPTRTEIPADALADDDQDREEFSGPAASGGDTRIAPSVSPPIPPRPPRTAVTGQAPRPAPRRAPARFEPLREMHRSIVLESYWRSGLVALAVTVPLAVLGVILAAEVLHSYAFGLFVGAPFAVGMISVLLFGFSRPQPFGPCVLVALAGSALTGFALLGFRIEGVVCLVMASPIMVPLVFLGAMVGYAIQSRPWLNGQTTYVTLAILVVLPALMAAESAHEPEPEVRAVETEIVIDAPPDKVWALVIAFPPLPEPDEWLFHTGVAYPLRAEIHGHGVGAVRHCVFTTGTFVEPIEIWDESRLLRFAVTEQPEPMREWSPYHIHPAHLDHYLVSRKGQFALKALPGGRTRLVGTTWYSNRMWPAAYWHLWSDYIIQRIHARVLTHIRSLAEAAE
jgi:hypothetical protein